MIFHRTQKRTLGCDILVKIPAVDIEQLRKISCGESLIWEGLLFTEDIPLRKEGEGGPGMLLSDVLNHR